MKQGAILCIFVLCFSKSYSQCKDDQCYQLFQNLIENEKENIQKVFDGILEKYGDFDGDIRDLLNRLNNTILKADLNLDKLEKVNNDIHNTNDRSNSTLSNSLEKAKVIEDEIKGLGSNSRNWLNEINDANKTADLIVSPLATLNGVLDDEKELEKWKEFLEKIDVNNYAKDIMNIPHSVSDNLLLLETLLDEKQNTDCFNKFHQDLKILFAQLARLIDFEGFKEEIQNIGKKGRTMRKEAEDILTKTNNVLEAEKNLKNIHDLTNETLILAEEMVTLQNTINDLLKGKENIVNKKLQDLEKSHKNDVKQLLKKYKVNEFELLLDELEDVNTQIKGLNNGENTSIGSIEGDINKYIDDIDYYSCVLEDCRYRKAAESVSIFNCKHRISN